MNRLAISCLAIALAGGVACHDTPAAPPVSEIVKAPGNNGDAQRDTVLSRLNPLRVLVSVDGDPARNVSVYWSVSLDYIIDSATTATDASGIASLPLTLGSRSGNYRVQAALGKTGKHPRVDFTVTALPGAATTFRIVSGGNQSDTSMARLGADYVAQVLDDHGNGVPEVMIDWTVTAGGGSVSPARSLSAAPYGYAVTHHTLGPIVGEQTVTATAAALPSAPPATFKATAVAPPPPDPDGYLPLAIEMSVSGNTDIYSVNANGTGLTRLTTWPGYDGRPAWSPDGSKIAFVSDHNGRGIWIMNADGSDQRQLATGDVRMPNALDVRLAWSPDGAHIAFSGVLEANGVSTDIYAANADGSGLSRLTTIGTNYSPTWSPDGRAIAFVSGRSGTQDIWVMNADGSGPRRVSISKSSWQPVWSPDGRNIAFSTSDGGYYSTPDIYVVSADGLISRRLVLGGQDPAWSADGKELAYTKISLCSYYYYYDDYQCSWDLAVVGADGVGASALTQGQAFHANGWSPNGKWLTMTQSTCGQQGCVDSAFVVKRNGTGLHKLATSAFASWKP